MMSAENTPKLGAGTLIAGATALALVLAAMGWWVLRDTDGGASDVPVTLTSPDQLADPSASLGGAHDAPSGAVQTPASPPAPRFDVVRVEPDGSAVIAGQAPAGADVRLMLDDAEVARTEADANGNFVALLSLPPESTSRVMRLMVDGAEDERSPQSVIIGPTAAPMPRSAAAPKVAGSGDAKIAVVPDAAQAVSDILDDESAGRTPGMVSGLPVNSNTSTDTMEPETDHTAAPGSGPDVPQVLLADQDGIRVLQDAGAASGETPLSLDSIAYDAAGMVSLSGRGTAGAEIRIFLDGVQKVNGEIGQDGQWTLALPGVDPGVYALRAEELDATGAVSDTVATPFKREEPALIAALDPVAKESAQKQLPDSGGANASQAVSSGGADQPVTDTPPQSTEGGAIAPTSDKLDPAAVSSDLDMPAVSPLPRPTIVTVQPGATLWAIARDKLGEGTLYVQVFDANRDKIQNPDLIYPGQVFAVPEGQVSDN